MPKFELDYKNLSNTVEKKTYKLADVKHRLVKVAFDVFRMKDGNVDELWQIQNSDDGDYIVAKYENEEVKEKTASKWEVLVSEASGNIDVFYKGHPITKFAAKKIGVSVEEFSTIKDVMPNKLASDKGFLKAFLNTLDKETKEQVNKLYPELF